MEHLFSVDTMEPTYQNTHGSNSFKVTAPSNTDSGFLNPYGVITLGGQSNKDTAEIHSEDASEKYVLIVGEVRGTESPRVMMQQF